MAEGEADEVRAAFKRLVEAPNHTFKLTTDQVPYIPQGRSEIIGKTEHHGWTHLTQTTPNRSPDGAFEFVFYRRKGVIKMPTGWLTVGDLIHLAQERAKQSDRQMPMRREFTMLTSRMLPAEIALNMVSKLTSFKREGDIYRAELSPEEYKLMFGIADSKSLVIPSKTLIQIQLEKQVPASMEMEQRFEEGGGMKGLKMMMLFTDVGSTRLEPPQEAKQRLERLPIAGQATVNTPITRGELSHPETMELARKVGQQLAQIRQRLFTYSAGNTWKLPAGKTSNEIFRSLFRTGICEDEMIFAIPDVRARVSNNLPDGQIGSVGDDFTKAVAAGECDVTLAVPGSNATEPTGWQLALRVDIKASDGTIVVVIDTANGATRVVETRDGIIPSEDAIGGDGFGQISGIKDPSLLKPE